MTWTMKSIRIIRSLPFSASNNFNFQPRRFFGIPKKSEAEGPKTPPLHDFLAEFYQQLFPGLKKEFFEFLKDVPQMRKEILAPSRNISDYFSKFGSTTVVHTRHELFAHLCSQGYTTQLATLLTKDIDVDMIPRCTLSQWTVAFLHYAGKASDPGAADQAESKSIQKQVINREHVKISNLQARFQRERKQSPHLVLLHVTSKEFADSIQKGISISVGARSSEFSVHGAFYLLQSVEFGRRWLTSIPKEWVVLVFEIPDSFFQRHRIGVFTSANNDWKKFCYHNFKEKLTRSQFEIDHDVIIGPLCKFRTIPRVHLDYTSVEPFVDSNQNICFQYAILNQTAADELNKYLRKAWDLVE